MAHSFHNLLTHVIFSTKDRAALLDMELKERLFPYVGGIVRETSGILLAINGPSDHVHLLLKLPATLALADALRVLKTNSTLGARNLAAAPCVRWQTGYAAFSVSQSNAAEVREYIARQEEHHRTTTFQEELIAFLRKHGIEYDERYIWE